MPLNPPACACNRPSPELRYCRPNNGVAWKCRSCGKILSEWLPHRLLGSIDVKSLPPWFDQPVEADLIGATRCE